MTCTCQNCDPCTMLRDAVCLSPVSKDLEGGFGPPEGERRVCREPDCTTLTTLQRLDLRVGSHKDCDGVPELDGVIEIRDVVNVFDGDGNGRGATSATFRWESGAGLVLGTLAGIANAGTHRSPAFADCQRCRDGVLEGQLHGTVCRAREPRFTGCRVVGAYRLRIDPGADGIPRQPVTGTLEGLLVCPCRAPGQP